jgi:hypothetical protein
MPVITIPKKLADDDLIIIPRREYKALVADKKMREFFPTPTHKKALARAELNYRRGKSLSIHELRRKFGT